MVKIKLLDVDLIRRFGKNEIVSSASNARKLVDGGKARYLSNVEMYPPNALNVMDKNVWAPPESKIFIQKEDYPKEDEPLFDI